MNTNKSLCFIKCKTTFVVLLRERENAIYYFKTSSAARSTLSSSMFKCADVCVKIEEIQPFPALS